MNTTNVLLSAVCGAALLMSSCAKENVMPAGNNISHGYQQRSSVELLQAASPALYEQLLQEANNNRAPVITELSGYFIPGPNFPQIPLGTCRPGNSVCAINIIADRSGNNTITSQPTDIFTLSTAVSNSNGDDVFIVNEQTPVVRMLRGIRDITTQPDGSFQFMMDYVQ